MSRGDVVVSPMRKRHLRAVLAIEEQVNPKPWTLQLRAEIYNITNTPSFQNPSGALGSAAFGSISSTGNAPPRQMQFAAKVLF